MMHFHIDMTISLQIWLSIPTKIIVFKVKENPINPKIQRKIFQLLQNHISELSGQGLYFSKRSNETRDETRKRDRESLYLYDILSKPHNLLLLQLLQTLKGTKSILLTFSMEEALVLIVGAGPAGLALAACLTIMAIPFILLESEDCHNSLWKKRAYDRCHLHLAKEFCSLPFRPHGHRAKKYMSKYEFISYVDEYVTHFGIVPRYHNTVEHASFDQVQGKWKVIAMDTLSNVSRVYLSTFLVVATGENGKGVIPDIPGLKDFKGDILHSSQYKSGVKYHDKDVLVVGCGNSGMEISLDLANHSAKTSIVVRNPFHVVSKDMIWVGMHLLKYFSIAFVDILILFACKFHFKNLSKYGIRRPNKGPFFLKATAGRSPVIDVGTVDKIKAGEIKVRPGIARINKDSVVFEDQVESHFDAIIFATGFRSTVCDWLKDYDYLLKDDGFPKNRFPNHWKGQRRLYCAGLARMGLQGASRDAEAIAADIQTTLNSMSSGES